MFSAKFSSMRCWQWHKPGGRCRSAFSLMSNLQPSQHLLSTVQRQPLERIWPSTTAINLTGSQQARSAHRTGHTSAAWCSCSWVAALHAQVNSTPRSSWCSNQGRQTSQQACAAIKQGHFSCCVSCATKMCQLPCVCRCSRAHDGHRENDMLGSRCFSIVEALLHRWASSGAYHAVAHIPLSLMHCRRDVWLGKCGRHGCGPLL